MRNNEKLMELETLRRKLDEMLSDESRLNTNEVLELSKELDELIAGCYSKTHKGESYNND